MKIKSKPTIEIPAGKYCDSCKYLFMRCGTYKPKQTIVYGTCQIYGLQVGKDRNKYLKTEQCVKDAKSYALVESLRK